MSQQFKWVSKTAAVSAAELELGRIRIDCRTRDDGDEGVRWWASVVVDGEEYSEWGVVCLSEDAELEAEAALSYGLATAIRRLGLAVGYLDDGFVVSKDFEDVALTIGQPDGTHRLLAYPSGRMERSVEVAAGLRRFHIDGLAAALEYVRSTGLAP